MTERVQISTTVSRETRRKLDDMVRIGGYTIREVIALGIDRMYADWLAGMRAVSTEAVARAYVVRRGHDGSLEVWVQPRDTATTFAAEYGLSSEDDALARARALLGTTFDRRELNTTTLYNVDEVLREVRA